MDINDLRTLFTVLVIAFFIGVVVWAYSSKRKSSYDEAANLVFDEEDLPQSGSGAGQQHN
jgi:cytochrome c oxidase cbb3-type subunit IV